MSRATAGSPGVNLMPLLDVLLCTMGTLIVILGVINREARLHPAKRLPGKAAEQQQMVEAHEDLQLRIEQLTTARDKTLADLQNSRTRLSGIEDSSRRLEDQLASLVAAAKQLPGADASDDSQRDELRKELAQLNSRRMQLEQDLQKARAEGKYRQPGYAVIPFDGLYKTSRRPIYIECRGDVVILQPEGIEFTRADFLGPEGPNNPLAAALRAAQEYWRNAPRPAPDMPNEAYPLLLVRPDGVSAYWDVRTAMSSWNADFGYEFVGADWKLEYPNQPDPQLIAMENRAVAEARQQLQWLAQISPELFARKANKVQYHVSPNGGGIVRDGGPSFGNDPFADDPLGGFGRSGRNGNSAIPRMNGGGGFGGIPSGNMAGGGESNGGNGINGGGVGGSAGIDGGYSGASGNGGFGTNASGNGAGQGGYGAGGSEQGGMNNNSTGGSGGGSANAANDGSGAGGGPEIADVGPRYAGAGNGTGGFGSGTGGFGNGSQGSGSANGSGGAGTAMARDTANGTNAATGRRNGAATASGGIPGSGSGSPSEYGGVQLPNSAGGMMNASTSHGAGGTGTGSSMGSAGGQSIANSGGYSTSNGGGGNSPHGDSNLAGAASGNGSSSSISSGGGSNGATALGSPGGDPNATSGTPTLSVGMPGQSQSAASYDDSQRQQQQQSSASHSMSRNRGKNWALPATRTASIPVQRPIRVECWSDRLVLVPDTRDQQPQIIPLGARTEDAVDPLVGAVRNYTTSWGIAGRGMYWRPQLVLNVNPNAEARVADLQTLLTDSGWDVKRK